MPTIQEVSAPTTECLEPQRWSCFDFMAAEVEVLEFMAQLVLTLKPSLIVETGTYRGLAARYMGEALHKLGRGKLITVEIDPELHRAAVEEMSGLGQWVECRLGSSLDLSLEQDIDLLFLDSEPRIRLQELDKFRPFITPRTVIVIHDVNSGCHGELRGKVLARDVQGELSVVLLP